jgi:hypothetical protein
MTAEREALDKALKQMECLQENLHKGMSKSIQRMQGFALMETVAEIRAAMRAADQQTAAHHCNRAAHHAYGYHACPDCNPTVMPTDPKTVAECSGKCFHVGGEFIAEDPACPKHGNADNPE